MHKHNLLSLYNVICAYMFSVLSVWYWKMNWRAAEEISLTLSIPWLPVVFVCG